MNARLADLMASVSLATDFGMGRALGSGMSSCLVGLELSEAVELSTQDRSDVFYLSLLVDLGCTATSTSEARLFGTEFSATATSDSRPASVSMLARRWLTGPRRRGDLATMRRDVAQRIARSLGFDERMISLIGQASERWDGRGDPSGLKGPEIAPSVRAVQVARDLVASGGGGHDQARKRIADRSGSLYDPNVATAALRLEIPDISVTLLDELLAAEPEPMRVVESLERALMAIADFTDLKSPFFLGHSRHVARLAAEAAEQLGLFEEDLSAVRSAGLVHDVGRVAISAAIWNKASSLSDSEMEQVRRHPGFSEQVLEPSQVLGALTDVAVSHHECLDGGGYHRGLAAMDLPMPSRVVAAADDLAALTEPRPHRPAMDAEQATRVMRHFVQEGCLDGDATEAVLAAAAQEERPGAPGLNPRESEILKLTARDMPIKQMAEELGLSRREVKQHTQDLETKAGVSSQPAAALFALEHGLLP